MFLSKIVKDLSHNYTEKDLRDWVWKHLKSGQVSVLQFHDFGFLSQSSFSSFSV